MKRSRWQQTPAVVFVRESEGCWFLPNKPQPNGYVYVGWPRCFTKKAAFAHRYLYEQARGPIPVGLQLDHLCRKRACVNPDHLEPVTLKENVLRGVGLSAQNAKKSDCKRGHPLVGRNLYVYSDGRRSCRECKKMHARAYRRMEAV